jgi:hypothetical protein
MKEITLRGCGWGVSPIGDDVKQLNILHHESNEVYMIQWSPEAQKELIEKLGMSNEDLTKLVERERARAEIEVAQNIPSHLVNGDPQ